MNSEIILVRNIKLDKNYSNVLNYTESQMVNLCRENAINTNDKYSFIRQERNTISVNFPYTDCLKANYIAFQNKDYDNKWFFAFIDDVCFVGDHTTQIKYTIDYWSTWWDYWMASNCFVIREHVADDTRGLHTIPEGIETGDYTINSVITHNGLGEKPDDFCYVLASTTSWKTKIDALGEAVKQEPNGGGRYNGVFSGAKYYRRDTTSDVKESLAQMSEAGQIENIVGIFIAPKSICPIKDELTGEIYESLLPFESGKMVGDFPNCDGYIPKNNKLLCFPYSYLMISNGVGGNSIYHYEDFKNPSLLEFGVYMVLCPSCSTKIVPRNYKGQENAFDYGIAGAKYPIASFQTDMYTNWLVGNSVNIGGMKITNDEMNLGVSLASGIAGVGMSVASGNIVGAGLGTISTGVSIATSVQSMKNHELIPPQITGATTTGDVAMAQGFTTPKYYKMSIKNEYAKILDSYFDRFGYKVNTTKVPNLQGRPHWSYIQIGADEQIGFGSVPAGQMEIINGICRKGVTIWKNHNEIGNYNLDNRIGA